MASILDSEYIEPTRPYSQNELSDMRNKLYRDLRLGKCRAYHDKCKHFYNVRINSKKEKEINENSDNIGNCSVCWKLSKTPKNSKDKAIVLNRAFSEQFYDEPQYLTYDLYDIENVFYKWLYFD